MPQSITRFAVPAPRALEASFDLGELTSDGGLAWLSEADTQLGLCAALAQQIPDWRHGPVQHSLETLIRQRVFQIACGSADQNDADTLRHAPLLKLVCGRLPASDPALASQPTLSRLENAVDRKACYRLAQALLGIYLQQRERAGIPRHILLDLDGTAAPTHGAQEGSAYHGYFRHPMDVPLVVFDGETDHLVAAVLRRGTVHASHGAVTVLTRLVRALRQRWPDVQIAVRADSGFAVPTLDDFGEREGLSSTLGLIPNPRLEALAAPLLAEAERQQTETGAAKVRLTGEARSQAERWAQSRRVIFKAEVLPKGPNTRFVVTNRTDAPLALYDWSVERGEPEQWVTELKAACFADRLSCHRFWANQFRLLVHAAAYWLWDTLRRWRLQRGLPRMQLATLRLRLSKIGGWVRQLLTRIRLHLAASHPGEPLWHLLAARPARL
jgi:Transposase DDE domain group 1